MVCRPLDKDCVCTTCQNYSRAFLHNLATRAGLPFAASLISLHNVAYTQRLTKQIRDAIKSQTFPDFVQQFVKGHYPEVGFGPYPSNHRFTRIAVLFAKIQTLL